MKNANLAEQAQTEFQMEQELALFLKIATGELKLAMREAASTVQTLTKTFMEMVRDVHELKSLAEKGNPQNSKETFKNIDELCNSYLNKVQEGTVGFQFYDKMTQRLCHTADSMQELSNLTEKQSALFSTEQWEKLKDNIRARYNTEKDRALFDAVMDGASIKEALRIATEQPENNSTEGSIELF